MKRRTAFAALAAIALSGFAIASAQAQQLDPAKPIRLVVPYPAGGGADGLARLIAQHAGERLGQTIIIDNKPGANTMLASAEVARRPADGHTLLYVASSFAINPALYKVPYDTERAFTPVGLVAKVPLIIIRNLNAPYKTLPDLLAAARARPTQITFASYGLGSPAHLGGELLESQANVQMKHIPYKGSAPALTDLVGGHVELSFSSIEPALQLIRTNKVAPIAVMTKKRIHALPDVPAVAEFMPGFEAIGWNGIVAPKGTPEAIVNRINAAINEAVRSPDVVAHMEKQGVETEPMSPAAFGTMIGDEIQKWSAVVKKAGVTVE